MSICLGFLFLITDKSSNYTGDGTGKVVISSFMILIKILVEPESEHNLVTLSSPRSKHCEHIDPLNLNDCCQLAFNNNNNNNYFSFVLQLY